MSPQELSDIRNQYGVQAQMFAGGPWNPAVVKLLSHITELQSENARLLAEVERKDLILKKLHAHLMDGPCVYFEQDNIQIGVATDLGEAYQESELYNEVKAALAAANAQIKKLQGLLELHEESYGELSKELTSQLTAATSWNKIMEKRLAEYDVAWIAANARVKALEYQIDLDQMKAEKAYLAQLSNARGGWISCSEKMPQNGQKIICLDGDSVVMAFFDSDKFHAGTCFNCDHVFEEVAHWMPIPEPPPSEAKGTV